MTFGILRHDISVLDLVRYLGNFPLLLLPRKSRNNNLKEFNLLSKFSSSIHFLTYGPTKIPRLT